MIVTLVKKGDEEAARHLHEMGARARDARPLWRELAPIVLRAEGRKFDRGFTRSIVVGQRLTLRHFSRTPGGSVHAVNLRRVTRYTLVKTGALRASLTIRGAPEQDLELRPDEMRLGTNVFYARFLRRRGFRIMQIDKAGRGEINDKVSAFLRGPL